MAIKSSLNVDPSFSMSSMTDLVFLLLIFFMITSTLVNPNALKLLLPKSNNQISTKAPVSVSVKHVKENIYLYYVNDPRKPVTFGAIEGMLHTLFVNTPVDEAVVSLYVDKSVPVEEVVNLMNIAKRNNYKVLLATAAE